MSDDRLKVAVLGGGSFGTALASIAADNGARVHQWMRDATLSNEINRDHRNRHRLGYRRFHPHPGRYLWTGWVQTAIRPQLR